MAAKKSTSGFAQRVGQEGLKAWDAHKDDPITTDSGAALPAGIEDGVAQVKECYIAQFEKGDNKGKDFFMIKAVVVAPETFTDTKGVTQTIAGRQINKFPIPLCQSKDWEGNIVLFSDNYNEMMDVFKRLGVGVTDSEVLRPENIEATCEAVSKAGIYTGFRTWVGKKEGSKVKVDWLRAVSFNGQSTDAVDDRSADVTPDADSSEPTTSVDMDALLAACDANDVSSQVKLKELALASEVTEDEIENAANWAEVVELINSKTTAAPVADDWIPKVDMVVRYKPIDSKTGKPRAKAINVNIESVNNKKKTVEILNLTDKKTTYKDVVWSALEHD